MAPYVVCVLVPQMVPYVPKGNCADVNGVSWDAGIILVSVQRWTEEGAVNPGRWWPGEVGKSQDTAFSLELPEKPGDTSL